MKQLLKVTNNVKDTIRSSRLTFKGFKESMQKYISDYNSNKECYNGFSGYVGAEGNWIFYYDNRKHIEFSIGFCYKRDYRHDYIIIDHIDIEEN